MEFNRFAVIPALATMLDKHENFDAHAQRRLIQHLLKKNIDGFYVGGATGEGFLMPPDMRKHVLAVSLDEIGGRIPVIAYTGSNDTKTAIELSVFAQNAGADAISSVRPYYGGFSARHIKDYYAALCDCVDIPLIIYNNANARLSGLDEVLDILSLPGCGGIKFTLADHHQMRMIKCHAPDKLVFSGTDQMMSSALLTGADGAIGTTYNVFPELYIQMRAAFERGDMPQVTRLSGLASCLVELMFAYDIFGVFKAVLELFGIGGRVTRSPNRALTDAEIERLMEDLRALKAQYLPEGIEMFEVV